MKRLIVILFIMGLLLTACQPSGPGSTTPTSTTSNATVEIEWLSVQIPNSGI